MKQLLFISILVALFAVGYGKPEPRVRTAEFTPDLTSLMRNPAMGWVLYQEIQLLPAERYWRETGRAVEKASIVYIRAPWAFFEPSEGHYAWQENKVYKEFIQSVKDRGLRLAFRVIVNSKDAHFPGAPDYVREAGAEGYDETGQGGRPLWTPTLTDPVFREKFEKFVEAFAREYDDPSAVDFIDAVGLGWWGEVHHLHLKEHEKAEVYEWICSAYTKHFRHVLLGAQVASEMSEAAPLDLDIAVRKYGYVMRNDGLGSFWLNKSRDMLAEGLITTAFFGESCYFSVADWDAWRNPKEPFKTHRDVLDATMRDALEFRANTLDLRTPKDANTWLKDAPDLVELFIEKGGYRLAPLRVSWPARASAGSEFEVRNVWRNFGVGMLPNADPRWKFKYRVAYALLRPGQSEAIAIHVDEQIDPGQWRIEAEFSYVSRVRFNVPPGNYQLVIGIVDVTAGNKPGLVLALKDAPRVPSWIPLGKITIRNAAKTSAVFKSSENVRSPGSTLPTSAQASPAVSLREAP